MAVTWSLPLVLGNLEVPYVVKDRVVGSTIGGYQQNLLHGNANWSGSDLKGKARKYGGRYRTSRINLINRINKNISSLQWYASTDLVSYHDGKQNRYKRMLVLTNLITSMRYVWA